MRTLRFKKQQRKGRGNRDKASQAITKSVGEAARSTHNQALKISPSIFLPAPLFNLLYYVLNLFSNLPPFTPIERARRSGLSNASLSNEKQGGGKKRRAGFQGRQYRPEFSANQRRPQHPLERHTAKYEVVGSGAMREGGKGEGNRASWK